MADGPSSQPIAEVLHREHVLVKAVRLVTAVLVPHGSVDAGELLTGDQSSTPDGSLLVRDGAPSLIGRVIPALLVGWVAIMVSAACSV